MNKFLPVVFCFILLSSLAHSQDFTYGENSPEELGMKKYNIDTAARAVVLNEYGKARISDDSEGNIRLSLDYHIKIKLLTTKGFDKAKVEILLRILSNSEEEASDIKGYTTYVDDNGTHQTVELDSKSIFTTKENKYWKTVKFTLPNLRPGCIIEYKYTTKSAALGSFPSWKLQDDIPKVNSKYDVHIPAFWNFNVSLRGPLKLTKNTAEFEKECFTWYGAKADCSFMVFQMDNIPAFVEEDYMTSPKNFMSAVYFELSDYTNPNTGQKIKVSKAWTDIDLNLKRSDYFGSQIKKKDQLKPYIAPVIAGKTDDLEKAKAVYAYIQKNIKWNKITSTGSENVRKALDSHSGTVGDINLALVAALNAAGIRTEAVLLSTRSNGFINKLYPVEDDFNYVVARANIGNETYMLDATDPLLGFDMLPLKCLNDQGRVMSLDKPSFWIDMLSLSKQRKSQTSSYNLTLQNNGKLKGTIVTYYNGYEGYEKRTAIKKFNTQDEYIEDLDERLVKTKILSLDITNLDSLDQPLVEKMEVEIDAFDNLNHNKLAFNPFFFDRITNNPFKLNERNYPVDKGMPSDDRFMLTVHLPADYVVDGTPQGVAMSLPNKGGKFITNFEAVGNTFTFSNVLQFTKSVYEAEEYPYLKEFYNKVIATEKAEIVFKKK
ncbi:transglutaminase domain-containing protein [Mucilaginibacter gilvus]|uniref:DUF3857 domain-containing protein n=1 Tax=Mucilaginibacter gilvus TaxID=2305909 RepID=A0A3S3VR52_9SPHI|nr:transglutaminase domain-containing protein [Mucilaginibacter gilvus]RWY53984.1 DUF3857 domain-containing protein [Mucilaginibacter gilvus]